MNDRVRRAVGVVCLTGGIVLGGLLVANALPPMFLDVFVYLAGGIAILSMCISVLAASPALGFALATFLTGLLFATVFVSGLGVGDTWIVYPPWVTWRSWLWPSALWTISLILYSQARRSRSGESA